MKKNSYLFVLSIALLSVSAPAFSGPTDAANAMQDSARELNKTTVVLDRGEGGTPRMSETDDALEQGSTVSEKKVNQSKVPVVVNPDNDVLNKPLNLQTILLDKPTREKIDRQRAAYINPPEPKEVEKVPPPPPPSKASSVKSYKPKKKQIYLPRKLSVSAVVIKPDGSSLVRINGKYNQTSSKHIRIVPEHTSEKGVALEVIRTEQIIPVGSTLLPRQSKVMPTYQMVQDEEARAKRRAIPRTKETIAKDTLEQVKIITSGK